MEQEIRRPDYVPRVYDRASSSLNCFLAAAGVTMMTLCLLGSAAGATAWAVVHLMGFDDNAFFVVAALLAIPVLWITIWTAGRAWYLERRLSAGGDVDAPVFKMLHYFKSSR